MFARETMAGHGMLFCLQEAALLYHVLDVEVTMCAAKSMYLGALQNLYI